MILCLKMNFYNLLYLRCKKVKPLSLIDTLLKKRLQISLKNHGLLLKVPLNVFFYDLDNTIIEEIIIKENDLSMTFRGGHNYEILENDTVVYEFKTGPYLGIEHDKELI